MKRILTSFTLLFLSIMTSWSQGITFFEGTWAEAIEVAKKEKKIIFVDCYTTWCGPCKAMAKNTFTKPEVGEFFNKNFINYKLDMEQEEGVKFGHKYPVSAYPTLYFINDKGDVVQKIVGGQQPDGLIQQGKKALVSDDRSADFEEAYNAGGREYDLVLGYVEALAKVGKPCLSIANDYLASNPAITEEQLLRFQFAAAVEADSKIFETVLNNKEKISAIVGEEVFEAKMLSACKKTFEKSLEYEVESLMTDAVIKSKVALSPTIQQEFEFNSKMQFYKSFGKKDKYAESMLQYAKTLSGKSPALLAKLSLDACKDFAEDKKMMKEALKWSKEAYKIEVTEGNLLAYVQTLTTIGETDKALNLVEDAIKDVEKNKFNPANLERLKQFVSQVKSKKG